MIEFAVITFLAIAQLFPKFTWRKMPMYTIASLTLLISYIVKAWPLMITLTIIYVLTLSILFSIIAILYMPKIALIFFIAFAIFQKEITWLFIIIFHFCFVFSLIDELFYFILNL